MAQDIVAITARAQLAWIEGDSKKLSVRLAEIREMAARIDDALRAAYFGEYREDEWMQASTHDGSSSNGA
jgi:hypothetical protein